MYNELRDAQRELDELKDEIFERDSKRNEYEDAMSKSRERQKLRELKLRKFKTRVMGALVVASLAFGTGFAYKQGQKSVSVDPKVETNINIYDVGNAPDEAVAAWAEYAYGKYCDDIDRINPTIAEENKNIIYMSYYVPTIAAYNEYINTKNDANLKKQNESYHNLFRKNAIVLEKNLGEKYSFSNTPFKASVVENDEVLVPYDTVINDATVPNDSQIVEVNGKSIIYVPVNYLYNSDNIKRK